MKENAGELTRRLLLKLDPALHNWLLADAEKNGRTPDMSIRFYLNAAKKAAKS